MKLNKTMKKLIAYVCAIAMVVSSITIYNNTSAKAADYSGLVYEDIANNSNSEFSANLKGSQIAIESGTITFNVKQYQNVGFGELYLAVAGISAANLVVTINGIEVTTEGTGVRMYNAADYLIYEYNVLEINSDGGSGTAIIYCPENAGKGTYENGSEEDGSEEDGDTTTEASTEPEEPPVEVPEGYTLLPNNWTTGGSTGAWNLYTGDRRDAETGEGQYAYVGLKNDETDPYKISLDFIETTGGDWLVQADVTFSGLTVGTEYKYVIKNGDDILATKIFEATADTQKTDMLNLGGTAQGTVMNLVATCEEYVSGTTIEYGKNIVEDAKWFGWFEPEGWSYYAISDIGTGYTLTDKNIGPNWYSIQTGIDNVEFLAEKYACEFTLTAASPKQFKVDNRTDDSTIFTEEEGGQWVSNEDGTYSYKYKGTFESTKSQFLNVRVSLGYFADEENYAANDVATFTVSDFTIYAVEPEGEDTTTEPATTSPADQEIILGEPTFGFDAATNTKYYNIGWTAVEGAVTYTSYVEKEDQDHIATAFHNGYDFVNREQASIDHISGVPGATQTLIVVAYDAEGTLIARGIKEITIPEMTEEEKALAAIVAKLNSEDNYAKGAEAIVSSGNDAENIVDGNMDSRWQASTAGEDHATGSEYFGVNLGAVKTIGQVIIAFEASYAAKYDIYVAGADEVYGEAPVASGTTDAANLISTVNFDETEAQFVKVVVTEFSENASTYGTSVYELAVFSKEEVAPVVEPIEATGLAAAQVENELKVSVNWTESEDAVALGQTYNVYVGDTKVLSNVVAGTYEVAAAEGTNTIKVTAVLGDKESAGQTTTVDVIVEIAPTIPEAATYDWSDVAFLGNGTPDAANADMYKAVAKEGTSATIVNVQVNSDENVIYIAGIVAPKMVVNGVESTEVIYNGGDQQFVKLTAFTDMYNDVQFYTEEGTLVGTVYVYYKDGIDNGVTEPVDPNPTDPDPTEPDTQPAELTFEQIAGTGLDITKGNYTLWINTTNVMEIAVDPEDADHIQGRIVSNDNNWDQWAVQYKVIKTGLTAGEEYTVSVDLKAAGNDGVIITDGEPGSINLSQTAEATITRTVTADENGSIQLTVGAGQVGLGLVIDLSNVVVKDSQGNVVVDKPVEPDTSAPTDETTTPAADETTTPATDDTTTPAADDTTTPAAANNTTTPAASETTTAAVANETTTAATVQAPAKATIKKVTAKKKSAKKLKLKIKKVSGAAGYQVAVYKTKKNAKKNKKALVKKAVTKRKVTLTSKKLKNKAKLFVRVRAYVLDANGNKVYGKWSKRKKVTIK